MQNGEMVVITLGSMFKYLLSGMENKQKNQNNAVMSPSSCLSVKQMVNCNNSSFVLVISNQY